MIQETEILKGPQAPFIVDNLDNANDLGVIDRSEVARSYYLLAKVHYDKAALRKAEKNFVKSLEWAQYPRDNFLSLKTLGFLIRISSELLEDDKAREYIDQTERLVCSLTATLGSLNAEYFYNVGTIHNYKGEFDNALQNYELAARKAREENEPELLAKCLLALARVSVNTKKMEQGIDYLKQLEQLLKIINKDYILGSMSFFVGRIYLELGKYDLAIKNFDESNTCLKGKKCWNMYGQILLNKGIAYKQLGDFDRSLLFFNLALDVVDAAEYKRLTSMIQTEIDDVNDSNVDIYLDRENRKIKERELGTIDFKHRFVLLEILFLLANNVGSYFDKERLAKAIWKDEYNPLIHDKLIYTSVSRLRKLIEPKTMKSKRKYIIRGKDGYSFNPLVKIRFHSENMQKQDSTFANVDMSCPV